MSEFAHKRQLPSTVYANPPDDPHYSSGPVHTCLYVRARVTGDWDPFLGPLERARAETGGVNQWVLKRRECSRFARVAHQGLTSASLGYPLSVFNKNSTLKLQRTATHCNTLQQTADHSTLQHTTTNCNTLHSQSLSKISMLLQQNIYAVAATSSCTPHLLGSIKL